MFCGYAVCRDEVAAFPAAGGGSSVTVEEELDVVEASMVADMSEGRGGAPIGDGVPSAAELLSGRKLADCGWWIGDSGELQERRLPYLLVGRTT